MRRTRAPIRSSDINITTIYDITIWL